MVIKTMILAIAVTLIIKTVIHNNYDFLETQENAK